MAVRSVQVDVAVVGAGTAGLAARRAVVAAGARVVLINAGPWDTTCARVGCMPSKLLLTAARAARDARSAGVFGVRTGEVGVDGRAVMARVQAERDRFVRSLSDDLATVPADEKIDGRARFIGPTTLQVEDGPQVEARAVVIATGASPSVPEAFEAVTDRVLTNETVFELEDLPRALAVVGAGSIGIELAAAFSRLGVRTTVFDEHASVGGLKDPDVLQAARELLRSELDLKLGVKIKPEPTAGGVRIRWTGPDGQGEAEFDRVLVAAGRKPNLDGLELAAAGLDLDGDCAPRHDPSTLRCGSSAVFIAGDAGDDLPVLHEASRQGEVAGRNAAAVPKLERPTPPAALSIVFTDPDMASVGEPLSSLGDAPAVGCGVFKAGRARIEDRPGGLIRLYARREDALVAGAEMVGPGVEHLAHAVAFMVQQKMTVQAALQLPFYHPTFEETLKQALRDLAAQFAR